MSNEAKSWPDLVGKDANEAEKQLKAEGMPKYFHHSIKKNALIWTFRLSTGNQTSRSTMYA